MLRTHLSSLKQRIDSTHMELAGCLQHAYDVSAYQDWGFPTWKDYVETELEISLRKAEYLMRNWKWFSDVIKDVALRKKIEDLGWTKASLLVGVVDQENAEEWIEAAKEGSREDLKRMVKDAKEKAGGDNVKPGDAQVFSSLSFRLTLEQKENIEAALDLAGQIAESDKPGHLLDLICMSFITDNRFQTAPGEKMLRMYLGKMEAILGAKFIVVDPKTLDIVMGQSMLKKLIKGSGE